MFSLSLFVVSGRRNNQNEKVTKLFPFLVKIFKKENQCLIVVFPLQQAAARGK